ncbi:hypothetical protein AJGP001_13550 [Planococcus faecalis]|uniref:Uncharacterized protein n=1 Tax=Planococcus faecalis TaxID=1598147 RepID=A0ABN4XKJ8_9BACL|nr:hypothetical protein AJGP001_13550 [Planococcus faecalis]OHX51962.1 hypothetical protein BB777_03555 [Planococcus faecalis]
MWGSRSRLRALWAWLSHKAEKYTRLRASPSPWRASAGVGGDLANLLCLGVIVGVGFWNRLAAVVHAPALFVRLVSCSLGARHKCSPICGRHREVLPSQSSAQHFQKRVHIVFVGYQTPHSGIEGNEALPVYDTFNE